MILVDYSQTLIAACLAQADDFKKGGDTKKMEQIARHVILSSLMTYKREYGPKYGELVVCCDGSKNWRRDVFPEYKAHRAGSREESDIDWSTIFSIGKELIEDIRTTFPFKVVKVDRAEGDDVVAVIVKYLQDNETIVEGLEETPQKVLVISSDGDFRQLYKYKNYAQWSAIQKKVVARPEKTFLLEKVLTGDSGDGVPNVRSDNQFFVRGEGRQKPVTAKMKQAFYDNPDGSTLTEEERKHLDRNRQMIDFDYIPEDVQTEIVNTYKSAEVVVDKNAVFEYFIKHRLRNLTPELQNFF